mmetsp:Transcript_11673/g.16546  ORF Transcript_11673/g.16546 Transcript_11673/m.16546 type:complete len:112 (-) Transcript_11673:914-1249(-)
MISDDYRGGNTGSQTIFGTAIGTIGIIISRMSTHLRNDTWTTKVGIAHIITTKTHISRNARRRSRTTRTTGRRNVVQLTKMISRPCNEKEGKNDKGCADDSTSSKECIPFV